MALVDGEYLIASDAQFDVTGELTFVGFLILFDQLFHVVGNMLTKDMFPVHLGAELFALGVVSRETFGGVRDVDATIRSALHHTEHSSTSGSASQANIEEGPESTWLVLNILGEELLASHFLSSLVDRIQLVLLQQLKANTDMIEMSGNPVKNERTYPTGQKQTSAVGSSIIGQANFHTEAWKFVGIGGTHHHITLDLGVRNLADDVFVGETHNQTILRGVVFVLVLNNQSSTSIVIGFSLFGTKEITLGIE